MSKPEHGVAAVVEGELGRAPTAPAAAEAPAQLDLLGNPEAETPVGNLVRSRQGAGRPAGAQNRVTRDIRRLILSSYKHPLVALAEIYSTDTLALAHHLGCKPIEAANLQKACAAEVSPYLAAKQAAVDDKGETAMPTLIMNFGDGSGAPIAVSGGALSIDAVSLQHLQNQRLSEAEAEGSHDDGSHDDSQPVEDEGESGD